MIDWDQVDTVLLDMDGTLLDLHFDNYFWQEYVPSCVARLNHCSPEAAKAELFPHMKRVEGTMDWYCLDYWSRALSLDIPALKRELCHLIGFRPQAEDFLDALGRAGKRRVLVTNAHPAALAIKCEHAALADRLEVMISAHRFRLPKERAEFWQRLQQVEAFDPARTLLIDDTLGVLRSARGYGIRHLLGVAQPDSARPPRRWEEFEVVESFAAIMPAAA